MKKIISLSVLIILVLIALIPTFLSTETGKNLALKILNHQVEGCLTVEKVNLHWFGPQKLENLGFNDPQGNLVFKVEAIETEASLFRIIFRKIRVGSITLVKPIVCYEVDEDKCQKKGKKKNVGKYFAAVNIVEGVAYLQHRDQKITLSSINIAFDQGGSSLKAGVVAENSGRVAIEGRLGSELYLSFQAEQFPSKVLDILHGNSLYTSAFGNTIHGNGTLLKKGDHYDLEGNLEATNLNGKVWGEIREGFFRIDPKSQLVFKLTPYFFKNLFETEEWSLANQPKMTMAFRELVIPINKEKVEVKDLKMDGDVMMEQAIITHSTLGPFSLKSFQICVDTKETREITYQGEISSEVGSTSIKGEVDFLENGDCHFCGEVKNFPTALLGMLSKKAKQAPYLLGTDLNLTFDGKRDKDLIKALYNVSSPSIQANGSVEGKDLDDLKVTALGDLFLTSRLASYLGEKAHFDLSSHFSFSGEISHLEGKVTTPHLEAWVKGRVPYEGSCLNPENVVVELQGRVKDLPLVLGKEGFNQGNFDFRIDGTRNLIKGHMDLGDSSSSGPELHTTMQIENFILGKELNFKYSRMLFQGTADRMPCEVLGLLLEMEVPYCQLFGSYLHFHYDIGYFVNDQKPHALIDLEAKGDGFFADLSFCLNDTLQVSETKPSCIHWEITPERYGKVMQLLGYGGNSHFGLNQVAVLDLQIKELDCPRTFTRHLNTFLCQSGFVGDIKIQGLSLRDFRGSDWLAIPLIEGSIRGEDFSKAIQLNLKGDICASSIPPQQRSFFSFTGEIRDLFTPHGRLNRDHLTTKGELSFDYVPVKEMLCWLPIREEVSTKVFALLGSLVNGRIYGEISHLSGPMTIDLKSTNLKAVLPLQLQNGVVFLQRGVEGEITLTPLISDTFLRDINPLFISGAWSNQPVRIYIDAPGFMMNLRPFSIQTTNVDRAWIDLGRIYVRNGGQLTPLIDLLKIKEISQGGVMEAWFTPIYLNLHQGVVGYNRFDLLLAGQVHLAFWGNINLVNEQVNMTLAISEQTLNKRFNIQAPKKTDMFQVRMTGTTSNPQVDWGGAATRIGILMAKSSGGLGSLVGGLLEQFVKGMGEDPVPPPSVSPFPWESTYPQAQVDEEDFDLALIYSHFSINKLP